MHTQTSHNDPYAEIAELYDLEHNDFDDDILFYLNSVRVVGDPVLEAGCGTGRILRAIAGSGFRVIGLDQSEAMLDRAHLSLGTSAAGQVELRLGSMERLDQVADGCIGTVIYGLNALLHLTDPAAQRDALKSAMRVLDPRGQLLLDVFNPTFGLLGSFDGTIVHEGRWERATGGVVDKISTRRITQSEQLIHTLIWYDITSPNGDVKRVATAFDLRYVFRAELELMLEMAGFADWKIYGSYDLDPFGDESERLIVTAEVSGR